MTALLLVLLACSDEPAASGDAPPPPVEATAAPAAEPGGPRVPNPATNRLAASHILVSFSGAVAARPNVTRTRDEARVRAEEARQRVLSGQDFGEVARAYSDDSTGPRGGTLGGFAPGTMVEPFEAAAAALAVGAISELVETPFGFHVIRRDALVEVHAAHLFVSWSGAERAPATVSRNKDAARVRMDEAVAALAAGQPWESVVEKFSDGPLKEDAGDLGWLGRNQLAPQLDAAVFDLDVGAYSAVIETPRGFHVLRRLE